ncbi:MULTISPECIES: WYL domain-containing protein [unclassified Thioalkalivibrio]|uniref:WYL domain-containing protein n=2 Tax=Thioalkalivibrio TaxID=106633 RepID=UPI0003760E3F|nr:MULTISPECIES: WYL domain-containing protein [unclassified Thioalkalivibrio]
MDLWVGDHRLRFMYQDAHGAITERDLVAKRLFVKDAVLYVEGWSILRNQHRCFRGSNIRSDVVSVKTGELWPREQMLGLDSIDAGWLKSPDESHDPDLHPLDRMRPEVAIEEAGLVIGSRLTRAPWHVIPQGGCVGLHESKKNGAPRKNPVYVLCVDPPRPKRWTIAGPNLSKRFVRPSAAVEAFLQHMEHLIPETY